MFQNEKEIKILQPIILTFFTIQKKPIYSD